MSVEFTPELAAKQTAHRSAGHETGEATEQLHRGTRYLVSYCECGFEFIAHPSLRAARIARESR